MDKYYYLYLEKLYNILVIELYLKKMRLIILTFVRRSSRILEDIGRPNTWMKKGYKLHW